MKKSKTNKYGEKLYPCHVSELDSNTRFTVYWTSAELEFADYLARNGGLCLVDGFGYFYRLKDLSLVIKKAYEYAGDYWRDRLSKS